MLLFAGGLRIMLLLCVGGKPGDYVEEILSQ